MARTVAQVHTSILTGITENPNLKYVDGNGITQPLTNNTSMYAIFNTFAFCVAVAQVVLEQLMDLYVANIEAIVARSAAASAQWLQAKMFVFQYSTTNPQIVQLINGVPQYPAVDKNLQIISACSVTVDTNTNAVKVKCATGTPLAKLNDQQIAAAASYLDLIGVDGVKYNLVSLKPDKVYIAATIYYNGMYSNMQTTVIGAITAYLQQLSVTRFDGSLLMSDLENLVRNITGVNDVVLNKVTARPDDLSYPNGASLILSNAVKQRAYNSEAGYMVPEDTTGYTLDKTLVFLEQ